MKIVQVAAIDMSHVKLLKTLNETCKEQGMEVHCVSSAGSYTHEIIDQGLNFHEIRIDRKISLVSNLKSVYQMYRLFKRIEPDIVHVHTPIAAVLGRIAAKLSGVPNVIYTAHGFYFHDGMAPKTYRFFFNIEKYIGRFFTDYIFTQSEEDYDVAVKNRFLNKSKSNNYLHISNGIDLDNQFNMNNIEEKNITNLKERYGIKEDDIVVTFIGRLVKEKGILDLLESYSKLKTKNIKYVIIGDTLENERDQEAYKEIMKFDKNPNIIFTGQVKNINEHLYLSDIFCLPSYREGMPRSIIEAMAMKNAVIATNIRGSREEVVDGDTGYLVNLNSSQEIADRINQLVENPELLNAMKESGYLRAFELYDETMVVKKQLKVFYALCHSHEKAYHTL